MLSFKWQTLGKESVDLKGSQVAVKSEVHIKLVWVQGILLLESYVTSRHGLQEVRAHVQLTLPPCAYCVIHTT